MFRWKWAGKMVCWGMGWLMGLLPLLGMTQPRPYTCGFVLESRAAIAKVYAPELVVLDLRPGDVLADVGGSNGYRMAMFATLYDSLTCYVQDIDSLCLNAEEFERVRAWHTGLRGSPLNARFELVLGDSIHSRLPEGAIDKLLVTAAYHHFAEREAFMADLRTKLSPSGRIYLIENVVRRDGQRRRRLCLDPLWTEDTLRAQFEAQGFVVEATHALGRWWTVMFVLRPGN